MAGRQGFWMVPPLWPDGECFILGGGPSLANVDIGQLRDRRVIAVNNAYQLGDWIDVLFFGDCRWYAWHRDKLLNFAGIKVTTCEQHLNKPGIKVVKRRNMPQGISNDRGILSWNLSSGACAIGLAVHFGVKRIILLGYDMHKDGDRHNWHDGHPDGRSPKRDPYPRFMRPFSAIAESLKRRNIECLNATEGSALDVFSHVKLETILENKNV